MTHVLTVLFAVSNGACVALGIADHGPPGLIAFNAVVMTLCAVSAIEDRKPRKR